MPVWHEATKKLREEGRLQVVGITQEQHPARCRLFAQWHGIDWPILWDPFNLTASKAVPRFTLIDEHGVVRKRGARPSDLEAFLATDFAKPREVPRPIKGPGDLVVQAMGNDQADGADTWRAVSHLLWERDADPTPALELVEKEARRPDREPAALFRLGVAHCMRRDSAFARPGDFARALASWAEALRLRPDQYIWRRRIQQYGPRPDKPYPFYGWVERATADVKARGEEPIPLHVPLTRSERDAWAAARAEDTPPDPKGLVPRDENGLLDVETAVAFDTRPRARAAQIHVVVRLAKGGKAAAWNRDAGPAVLWLETHEGWTPAARRQERRPPTGTQGELPAALVFEVGVRGDAGGARAGTVEGYVLCPLCLAKDGTCVMLRKDLRVAVDPPAPR